MRSLFEILVCLVAVGSACAAEMAADAKDYLQAKPADMKWWREARFGMFVHWGPVSLKGTEISWSRGSQIPVEEYDNLYKQFNPTRFNAREWVAVAKAAGMKHLVFTTKHHDGFCEWDTKLTDYKITNSPFKRDVVKELADACREAGIRLGFYYSPPDWRSQGQPGYVKYMHGHLRELCGNYGKVDIVWFDGLGGSAQEWDAANLFKMIRELQPHVIINNRAGLPADFDTPEQWIGEFNRDRAWETCMTLGGQWAWKPNDNIKSLKQCIQTLVQVVGGDGNFLFNVGPMPTGEIEPRQVDRLKEMGQWMSRYGKTIYGTRGGPYKPGRWGAATCKGSTVYLHILDWPGETITLPALPAKIAKSSLLTGGKPVVRQTPESIEISVRPSDRQEIDTIVALKLDSSAEAIEPMPGRMPSKSLAFGKPATASNVYADDPALGPDKAFDDDDDTRWAADAGTHQAWIAVDLAKPQKIGRVVIGEEPDVPTPWRVREFELQYKDGDTWVTFARGNGIGRRLVLDFTPITAQVVRLNILKADEGPTIPEILILPPPSRDG